MKNLSRLLRYYLLRGMILLAPAGLMACGSPPEPLPAPPEKPIEVKVAVPVACEIEQVPASADPAKTARKGDDVFTLAKIALASRRVLMGENDQLRTANQTPCPGGD